MKAWQTLPGIMAGPSKNVDWDAIKRDFCAGIMSLREIAAAHSTPQASISYAAISIKAKAEGWERNLAPKIQARAEKMLEKAAAASPTLPEPDEQQVIEANAARIAQVRSEHRVDILRARKLVAKLFDELDRQGEELTLQQKASIAEKLISSLKNVVNLDREAYGIDKIVEQVKPADDEPIDRRELARQVAFMLHRVAHGEAA